RPAGVAAAGARGEEPTIRVPEAEPEPAAEGIGPTGRPEGGASEAAEGPGPSLAERGIERPGGRAPSLRELFWGEEE
ncbi:MAG TPA: hypothetical protein VNP94_09405, partial [Actinomycetota bacterium]|nr:hypothetical protein [Actinomycetota bacterium]